MCREAALPQGVIITPRDGNNENRSRIVREMSFFFFFLRLLPTRVNYNLYGFYDNGESELFGIAKKKRVVFEA